MGIIKVQMLVHTPERHQKHWKGKESWRRSHCNKHQLYNMNLKRRRESKPNDAGDIGDSISSLLWDLKLMHVIETIIVKKRSYFFYLSTERQVEDVVKFAAQVKILQFLVLIPRIIFATCG